MCIKCISFIIFTYTSIVWYPCVLNAKEVKNIILMIGDGMGTEHRKAAQLISKGKDGALTMDSLPVNGFIKTYSADNEITDSAAAATAMATGEKTKNGTIGMDKNLKILQNIVELAQLNEMSTGIVTTTQLSDATPAAFSSHIENRSLMLDIAEQIKNKNIDVLMGGGEDEFLPTNEYGCYPEIGERTDGKNLILEFIHNGYLYVCDSTSFDNIDINSTTKLLGLFADEGMSRPYTPSLSNMVYKAIQILSKNKSGFLLIVEGGQIDWASHANDANSAISDVLSLDESVKTALDSTSDDTLIIVVADHETGGMSISPISTNQPTEDGPFYQPDGTIFYINWSTTGHTNVNVPVSTTLSSLNGIHDNTYIHTIMSNVILSKSIKNIEPMLLYLID